MKLILIYILILFCLFSCKRKENNDYEVFEDFETLHHWDNSNTIVKENDHSENYICKLDSLHEYSVTFKCPLKELKYDYKKLKVRCRLLFPEKQFKSKIIFQIDSAGKVINWQCRNIEETIIVSGGWTGGSFEFDIPQNIDKSYKISVYFWNPDKIEFMVDDMDFLFK